MLVFLFVCLSFCFVFFCFVSSIVAEGQACPVILARNQYTSVSMEKQLENRRCKTMVRNDQLHTYKVGKGGECNY